MAVAQDYSIFHLNDFINNDQAAVNFFQVQNLIRNNHNCPRCNQILVLSLFNSNVNVGYVLRCPNRNCTARKSLIVDTFLTIYIFHFENTLQLFIIGILKQRYEQQWNTLN